MVLTLQQTRSQEQGRDPGVCRGHNRVRGQPDKRPCDSAEVTGATASPGYAQSVLAALSPRSPGSSWEDSKAFPHHIGFEIPPVSSVSTLGCPPGWGGIPAQDPQTNSTVDVKERWFHSELPPDVWAPHPNQIFYKRPILLTRKAPTRALRLRSPISPPREQHPVGMSGIPHNKD
ncbi:unnamed protein product [Pleuronectes platessa]|uniref:Uncharacterized protein n=1 Tax=Pleuronectes platessa TaxID=8262 RepID=A0A9N7TG08_PLEPL|nr:unnamed protein product [Pleuronectes platessa]